VTESLYQPTLRISLSQGDILRNVRFAEPLVAVGERTFDVMVISHNCELDKQNSNICLVSRVKPITDVSGKYRDHIRLGKVGNVLYLPPEQSLSESYVDFRYTYRLPYAQIGAVKFTETHERVFQDFDCRTISLSDYGQEVLRGAIAAFFLRPDQANATDSPGSVDTAG
jgi:hypothetical protein